MAKASSGLLKTVRDRKRKMNAGKVLDKKTIEHVWFRFLPFGEDIGSPAYGLFSENLGTKGMGTTSLRTWGLRCPVMDYIDEIKNTGGKEEKNELFNLISPPRTEFYMGGVVCNHEGEPGSIDVRVLPCRASAIPDLINWIEEMEQDPSDPREGRPFLHKKVEENNRVSYSMTPGDPAPVSEDEEFIEEFCKIAEKFDPLQFAYPTNWDVLCEMYELISGKEVPSEYEDQDFSGARMKGEDSDEGSGSSRRPKQKRSANSSTSTKSKGSKKTSRKKEEPEEDEEDESPVEDEEPESDEDAVANEGDDDDSEESDDSGHGFNVDDRIQFEFEDEGMVHATITAIDGDTITVVADEDESEYEVEPDDIELISRKKSAKKSTKKPAKKAASKPADNGGTEKKTSGKMRERLKNKRG